MSFFKFRTLPHEEVNHNFDQAAKLFFAANDDDVKFIVSPATAAPTVNETKKDVTYDINVKLATSADEPITAYCGKVKVALVTTAATSSGVAVVKYGDSKTITTGNSADISMVDGELDFQVVMTGKTATGWTATSENVTVTISKLAASPDPVTAGISSATFVATVAANPA